MEPPAVSDVCDAVLIGNPGSGGTFYRIRPVRAVDILNLQPAFQLFRMHFPEIPCEVARQLNPPVRRRRRDQIPQHLRQSSRLQFDIRRPGNGSPVQVGGAAQFCLIACGKENLHRVVHIRPTGLFRLGDGRHERNQQEIFPVEKDQVAAQVNFPDSQRQVEKRRFQRFFRLFCGTSGNFEQMFQRDIHFAVFQSQRQIHIAERDGVQSAGNEPMRCIGYAQISEQHPFAGSESAVFGKTDADSDHAAPEPQLTEFHIHPAFFNVIFQDTVGNAFQNSRQEQQEQRNQENQNPADSPYGFPAGTLRQIRSGCILFLFLRIVHRISLLTAPYSMVLTV